MKIGRNSPCPCGSGKKYKFCCLNNDRKVDTNTLSGTEIISSYEYCVIFDDTKIEKQQVAYDDDDTILRQIYKPIGYIMHLPRSMFDLLPINEYTECPERINSHNIITVPLSRITEYNDYDFTLVLCELTCMQEAKKFMTKNRSQIGLVNINDLSSQLLCEQWQQFYNRVPGNEREKLLDIEFNRIKLYDKNHKLGLTLFYMENWLNALEDLECNLKKYINENYYNEMFTLRSNMIINEFYKKKKIKHQAIQSLPNKLSQYIQLPITISLCDESISESKKETINLLGIHNAISNNGIYIEKYFDSSKFFLEIKNIEDEQKKSSK